MAQLATHQLNVDLTRIENAEVRRAMRQLVQQMQETIAQQQMQIEALLELILEKHVASLSEFKRHMQRIAQQPGGHSDRLHGPIVPPVREQHTSLQVTPREVEPSDEDGRQVYRL